MSQPRFATITSDLLARKGEARPWSEGAKQPLPWQSEMRSERIARPKIESPLQNVALPQTADWKKCSIRISAHDYERLGILAVKQGTSRHHLLQQAVEQFFDGVTRQFSGKCACLGAEDCASQTLKRT